MRVSEWYRELNLNSVFETLGLDLKCGGHALPCVLMPSRTQVFEHGISLSEKDTT